MQVCYSLHFAYITYSYFFQKIPAVQIDVYEAKRPWLLSTAVDQTYSHGTWETDCGGM